MKPYRVLIMGHHPLRPEWNAVQGVYQMLTFGITEAFAALPGIELHLAQVLDYLAYTKPPKSPYQLPQVDIAVIVAFCNEEPTLEDIQQGTGATKVVSFREIPGPYEHSFVFSAPPGGYKGPYTSTTTRFLFPCCKRLLRNMPKVPGSILVDHTWHINDHTAEIEGWLEGYTAGPVYRLIRPGTENHPLPGWMRPIHYAPYPKYLEQTEMFERHIITHIECYPFAAAEFAARGTQILTPPGLIPSTMLTELQIPVFCSQAELRAILHEPVPAEWNDKINLCTDYGVIAKRMHQQFQEWLRP